MVQIMTTITFDTLSTARRLREKGASQELAEAIADEMRINSSVDISHLATREEVASKEEVAAFKSELKSDLKQLDTSLRGELKEFRAELKELRMATKADIAIAKFDTIKWIMGSIFAATIAIITTIIKVMH